MREQSEIGNSQNRHKHDKHEPTTKLNREMQLLICTFRKHN